MKTIENSKVIGGIFKTEEDAQSSARKHVGKIEVDIRRHITQGRLPERVGKVSWRVKRTKIPNPNNVVLFPNQIPEL